MIVLTSLLTGSAAEWVTAVVAAGALWVAWIQLRAIRKTDSADFVHRLDRDFFTPEVAKFIQWLERNEFRFVEQGDDSYFLDPFDKKVDIYEVDFHLLNPLENLATLAEDGLVKLDLVYSFFDWYVEVVWENSAISNYVTWLRKQKNSWDCFTNLEALYNRCRAYGDRQKH
jgi:hypothetical protein